MVFKTREKYAPAGGEEKSEGLALVKKPWERIPAGRAADGCIGSQSL